VQTGCDEPCAYCIIPVTRGRPRSRPLGEILDEVTSVSTAGFKEVAVTGVHLGSWGRDLQPGGSLLTLLRALADHPADVAFRISSLEPMDCSRDVRALMVSAGRFAPHVHLPLQHASDAMLGAMRRPYSIAYYEELIEFFAAALPHVSIGSDILVGFPGECDEDHRRNEAWLEASPLTHLHVFPYSDRPGTAASGMAGKVHGRLIRERALAIRTVGSRLTRRFHAAMHGTIRPGLTLEDGTLVVTDNYLKVRIAPGLPRNVRVHVELDTAQERLTGVVVGAERPHPSISEAIR
jgi:threonylcarbamoyladenosine tRNA methylthiotransferase MtaB